MKNRKKAIIITSLILIVVLISVLRLFTASKPKGKEVETAPVVRQDLTQSISVTGNIEANNKEEIILNPAQKVLKIYAQEGQEVKAGDVILKLDTSDYEYQLKKARLSLNSNTVSESGIEQAEINLQNAKRSYEYAKENYEKNLVLFEGGYISQDEIDNLKKTVMDLEAQLKLAELSLKTAKDTVKEQKNAQSKQNSMTNLDIQNLTKKISDSTIKAGIDGKITKLEAKENQYPSQGENTILIYDMSKYKLSVMLSQYDAVSVTIGQKAKVKVKGLPKEYSGTVTDIGSSAELVINGASAEAKVKIEITLDNPDDSIKVGYEADADIMLKERRESLSVKYEAVMQETDGRKYVFTIDNNKAVKRYVKTGIETDFDIEILEGLKEGDKYIVNPPSGLKDGDQVQLAGGK